MMHATVNDCSDKNHGTFCFQQEDIGSVIELYNFPGVKDKARVLLPLLYLLLLV